MESNEVGMPTFLESKVYYPDRVPWMGRCSVTGVDYRNGTVEISNGHISTSALAQMLTWCRSTGQVDKSGVPVYQSDILEDESGVHFTVCFVNGVPVLNRLPDGGDINIPIQYCRFLRVIGSVNSKLEFKWLEKLKDDWKRLLVSAEDAKGWSESNRKKNIGLLFRIHVKEVGSRIQSYFEDSFQKSGMSSFGKEQWGNMRSHFYGVLNELGTDIVVQRMADRKVLSWEFTIRVQDFEERLYCLVHLREEGS